MTDITGQLILQELFVDGRLVNHIKSASLSPSLFHEWYGEDLSCFYPIILSFEANNVEACTITL